MAVAVGFDDQLLGAPEEVDFVGAETDIHFGLGKAVAAAETEEEPLEFTTGEVGFLVELLFSDQPQVQGSSDRRLENRLGRGAVQVPERPRRLGNRDAVPAGRNCGNEGVGSVDRDPRAFPASPVSGDAYVDRARVRLEHPP
jgi:hypothetical protein